MLVVIGGGPYGIATAATAIEKGIETVVLGRPLGFWRDNMPEGRYLRSGPDWHLDASGVHTFEASRPGAHSVLAKGGPARAQVHHVTALALQPKTADHGAPVPHRLGRPEHRSRTKNVAAVAPS